MRNLHLKFIIGCAIIASCLAGPLIESKSSKNPSTEKVEVSNKSEDTSGVTDEERKFLREIEAKFNIRNEDDEEEDDYEEQSVEEESGNNSQVPQAPLPAVIAIEIVNDNSTDGKGKRTIDANLGYGYRTNNGYFYSQFGKPEQKGKFMIYPYSQHDIPAAPKFKYHTQIYRNKAKGEKTIVEIQPSKAFQLIPVNQHVQQEQNTYKLDGAVSQIRTKYENVQAIQSPPPHYETQEDEYSHHQERIPTTLYTTYNGGQLSGLSGHFPVVMPNYYVSPSQILRHPQYQNLGLSNQEHEPLPQKNVIPVLILRIPSSHIQNPTAEFFPKLPRNNPYAMSLNNINIQALVNQYLASIQQQYEQPSPHIDTNALKYSQPAYYEQQQQQQPIYSIPTANPIQYSIPPPTHYIPTHQPQYEEEGHGIRYVVPHPSPTPETQQISHHVYGPPPAYENQEEEQLPFSENYPDPSHTQVIYHPQYQGEASAPSNVHTVQNHLVNPYPIPTPAGIVRPHHFVPPMRTHGMHKYSSVIPAASTSPEPTEDEEEQSSKAPHAMPFNYHAHPYPKRQVKVADSTSSKKTTRTTHHNRKLMTAVKTTP